MGVMGLSMSARDHRPPKPAGMHARAHAILELLFHLWLAAAGGAQQCPGN
jgi:hypothetical protein